jgi:ribonuclease D
MKHADWRLRPMTPTMLRYATLDVHYLVSLYKLQVIFIFSNTFMYVYVYVLKYAD